MLTRWGSMSVAALNCGYRPRVFDAQRGLETQIASLARFRAARRGSLLPPRVRRRGDWRVRTRRRRGSPAAPARQPRVVQSNRAGGCVAFNSTSAPSQIREQLWLYSRRSLLLRISAMYRTLIVAASICCIPMSVDAEVFKCTEDGKTVFQDKPCRGSGTAIIVKREISDKDSNFAGPTHAVEEGCWRT